MSAPGAVFKRSRAAEWTAERVALLTAQEIRQLRENAERLNEPALVALCSAALQAGPKAYAPDSPASRHGATPRRLIARTKAFEARGVWLQDARTSWSGIRKSDGAAVFALWASAIVPHEGGWACRLWTPNVAGTCPWSDQPAGRERRAHCEHALAQGGAEGMLVYGHCASGQPPQDKASTVQGVDPHIVLRLRLESRGAEFWARWR